MQKKKRKKLLVIINKYNPRKIKDLFFVLQAGKMGFDDAYFTIGEMYEYGEHGNVDFATARSYYEKAASTGNPSAQVWPG